MKSKEPTENCFTEVPSSVRHEGALGREVIAPRLLTEKWSTLVPSQLLLYA